MGESLKKWVINQLNTSGWSISELARRGRLNQSYVSAVLSGRKEPGPKFYQGMSRAFGVTLESVERLETDGVIPESRMDDPAYLELMEVAQSLTDSDLQEVLHYASYRLWLSKKTTH